MNAAAVLFVAAVVAVIALGVIVALALLPFVMRLGTAVPR